ncbi:DUF6868 family protein [Marinospirillum minutulum]|uniref:DUF6868 family protein n=1 Tax=Marinospirillum minutulum TaxID=64974 RepID=UPI000418E6E7|nr:hypothetical protein [Marinospirillum minutulum]
MSIAQLTTFFGWVAVINLGYLLVAALILLFMKSAISSIHSKMFDLDDKELTTKYFDFLSNYKIMTLVFTVAPYLALKIMA